MVRCEGGSTISATADDDGVFHVELSEPGSYQVEVDGQAIVVGGTSAVAPLWAALIALLNQQLGKSVGFFNSSAYGALSSSGFHDIVSGNNGAYSAGPGWDACTGWGSPSAAALLAGLGGQASGGD